MMARIPTAAACVFCCLFALDAYAQPAPVTAAPPPPANLAYVEGTVDVVHDGVVERADPPALLIDGDIVRTGDGRAEVIFADGTLLHLDRDANLEVLAPDRVRLVGGRVIVRVSAAAVRPYFVDTPAASVRLDARGEYTVGAVNQSGNDLEVSVARGNAEIDDGSQRVLVRAGESVALAAAGTRAVFRTFNSARWDAFTQWANDRANGFTQSRSSAQLPVELRPYGPVFDEYGRWDNVAPYGAVWLPAVGVGWRPYYEGSWGHTSYGWTWYGRDRWAWPTHHYGRWGYNGASWFWIPTNVWGPGWVNWGFSAGYVSWSPLGFDGRAAIGFWPGLNHGAYAPYSPWRGWTVVPRRDFGGPRRPIRAFAIDGNRLDETSRRAMVFTNGGPPAPGGFTRPGAVPRGPAPVRRAPSGGEIPTYDRTGPIRRPGMAPRGSDAAVPRLGAAPALRSADPPPVQYIGGSARRFERAPAPGDAPSAVNSSDGRSPRPSGETTADRDRRVLTTRPDRPEVSGAGEPDRSGADRPAYRGRYERPSTGEGNRARYREDGDRSGGSIRTGGAGSGTRAPAETGSGARERGGSREGGGPSAGAPSQGGRGAGGGGGDSGGRSGGAVRGRPR
jgi:hypothetical protein